MNAASTPSVLFSMFVAALFCLMLWLPTARMESQLNRAVWHLAGAVIGSALLLSQFSFAAAVSLVLMLVVTNIGFALFVFFEKRSYQRSVRHEDFEAARFLPSQFMSQDAS